jgi:hypothetical protein
MEKVKTIVVEEHNEAFIAWQYAINKEIIPAIGNVLIHVDEHSDMVTPRFNQTIHDLSQDLDVIKSFTYSELGIASFIVPAVYLGIYDEVYWIKQKHRSLTQSSFEMFVSSYNNAGKKLISGKQYDVSMKMLSGSRLFNYHRVPLGCVNNHDNLVLDIDLDYFSCTGNPIQAEEVYIEITREEYYKFLENPYHRIRFIGIGKIEVEMNEGKYYYVLNYYNELYPNPLRVDEHDILIRIKDFVDQLNILDLKPRLIDICRSRFSGYTPADQWQYIEANLLSALGQIYNLDVRSVSEL